MSRNCNDCSFHFFAHNFSSIFDRNVFSKIRRRTNAVELGILQQKHSVILRAGFPPVIPPRVIVVDSILHPFVRHKFKFDTQGDSVSRSTSKSQMICTANSVGTPCMSLRHANDPSILAKIYHVALDAMLLYENVRRFILATSMEESRTR